MRSVERSCLESLELYQIFMFTNQLYPLLGAWNSYLFTNSSKLHRLILFRFVIYNFIYPIWFTGIFICYLVATEHRLLMYTVCHYICCCYKLPSVSWYPLLHISTSNINFIRMQARKIEYTKLLLLFHVFPIISEDRLLTSNSYYWSMQDLPDVRCVMLRFSW